MRRSLCREHSGLLPGCPIPEFGAAGIQFLKDDGIGELQRSRHQTQPALWNGSDDFVQLYLVEALDDGSAIRGPGNDFVAEDARCRRCDYGYSTFDVPHRFVATDSLYAPGWQRAALFESWRDFEPGVGGLAVEHHRQPLQSGARRRRVHGTGGVALVRRTATGPNCYAGINPVRSESHSRRWLNPAAFFRHRCAAIR